MQRGRHKMDVDTIHYYPEPEGWRVGAMRRHGGFDHFAGNAEPSGAHTLINGLPDLYFLTGYQRAADVALLVADSKMKQDLSFSATREGLTDANAYILAHLIKPDPAYLDRVTRYFARHVEAQKQPAWPAFWIDYATAPIRELLTVGDATASDLANRAFLTDYALLGRLGGAGEAALAYEIQPTAEAYRLVAAQFERPPSDNPKRTILNSAGVLNALPHMMWAMEEGRKRFGDYVAPKFELYRLPREAHFEPVDLSGVVNRNPRAVDLFQPDSPDTTAVDDGGTERDLWRFDFGPLEFWDTACIPVEPATRYPFRARAPRPTPRNLAGLRWGAPIMADGVRFALLPVASRGGKAVWVLEPGETREFPLPEGTRAVHVLGHFCGSLDAARRPGCEYEFVLADGNTHRVPLTYGQEYAPIGSALGATAVRRVLGQLCRYTWASPGAPIRAWRVRDTGLGHQFVVAAATAEVPGPARPEAWPAPVEPAAPDGLIYGLEGPRVSAASQVDPAEPRTEGNLPALAESLPDWKTNRLLTDFVGVLENLEPVRFKVQVPDGRYEVRVNLARLYAGCRNDFYVRAQDEPVFDFTESSYTVEPARVFMTTVTNGLFTLELGFHEDEFEKNSNWAIRALELKRLK